MKYSNQPNSPGCLINHYSIKEWQLFGCEITFFSLQQKHFKASHKCTCGIGQEVSFQVCVTSHSFLLFVSSRLILLSSWFAGNKVLLDVFILVYSGKPSVKILQINFSQSFISKYICGRKDIWSWSLTLSYLCLSPPICCLPIYPLSSFLLCPLLWHLPLNSVDVLVLE